MGVDGVTTLISNTGFPIACVIFLGLFIYQFSNRIINYNKEREDKLYEIIARSQAQLDKLEDSFEDYVTVLGKMKDELHVIKKTLKLKENEDEI